MAKKTRKKLSMEISSLTIVSSISTVLILGLAMVFMFMFFFSRQTENDMEYFIDNTLKQFDDKVQYIKDGAISIRHNNIIDDFFTKNHYDQQEAETQLTYCMNLFSPRNMVDQNIPFIVHAYVFNNKNDFIRSNYYPTTMSASKITDDYYKGLHKTFLQGGKQYYCYTGEKRIDLCFTILNHKMRKVGSCIVSIQNEAIEALFSGVQKYENSSWTVIGRPEYVILSGGSREISDPSSLPHDTNDLVDIEGVKSYFSSQTSSFGIHSAISIGRNNIYALLKPTIISFLLILILVVAAVTFLVLGISYRMTKPLKDMAQEIGSYGHENLTMHMSDYPIEEFHSISVVFNDMADRINHLVTQVYEKELLATRAQVKFLQSQINPHFQFNILAMFSLRAKMAGDEDLYQGLRAFSKLIQGKIFREKEIKIPLSEEIELVKFYLYLQTSRFGDKITYDIEYGSPEVEQCLIPRLLIEPLVENAVSHGLEPKSGPGHILIQISESENNLHIVVEDDGVGFAKQEEVDNKQETEKPGHTSTGLANTMRLLDILYGENHKMTIHGEPGKGTKVEIIIPVEGRAENVEGNYSG